MTPDVQSLVAQADAESALLRGHFNERWNARLARWEEQRRRDLRILRQMSAILNRAISC